MEGENIVTSTLGSFALFGGTLGILAALRNKIQKLPSAKGVCKVCSGKGVQECTLCYGRGSIAQPGYVNVANPLHRRPCLRCDGAKQIVCCSCAGARSEPSGSESRIRPNFGASRDIPRGEYGKRILDGTDAEDF